MTRKKDELALPGTETGAAHPGPAVGLAAAAAFDEHGRPRPAVQRMLLQAVEVQRPVVLANLRRLRKRHPDASAYELGRKLERDYLSAMSAGGAAIGATAIIPGVGTIAALSVSAAATVVFLEATALYAQSVAELHGIRLQDPERAQLAVMAIVLGEEGTAMLSGLAGHAQGKGKTPMQAWGRAVGSGMPLTAVKSMAGSMQRRFLRKMAVQGTASAIGKSIPYGIGAVVGGTGNYLLGRAVIKSTLRAFGPAPVLIPAELAAELDAPRKDVSGTPTTPRRRSAGRPVSRPPCR
ncbi:hypothetical protein [Specibacter cremeus]|uniref:hypothetical protein n=1 Tax=Specibacter cremeus TaxID=1629051 RepID=UPI00197BE14C|nr:hypothetical protein [Specibacter cremeus]